MIVALNYLVPLVLALIAFIAYKTKRYVVCGLVAFIFVVGYNAFQPSYIPKGTVPPMPIKQTEFVDKPIVDRTKKVMSIEEREARMQKQENESEARREQLINEMKEKQNG